MQRSKIFQLLYYLIEKRGSLLLHIFSAVMGIRVFFEMTGREHRIFAAVFCVLFLLSSIFRKRPIFFFPFMISSISLFTCLMFLSHIDFYKFLSLVNNLLILCAFIVPNPVSNLLIGAVLTSLIFTYKDSISFYFIKGSMFGLVVNTVIYSLFGYLIRFLYKKKIELQRTKNSKQLILRLLPDPLVIHRDGKIAFINEKGLELIGAKSMDQLVGKSILQLIPNEYHERVVERMVRTYINKESTTPLEIKIKTLHDELLDVETTGVTISYGGKPAILTMVRDITALKNQTAELIQKSDKLSLVGQLAAGIAHEIRNPLTSLRGFIQLLQYKSEENKEYFEIMLSELDRINLIVGEFLILAKPHMVKFSQKNINEIIRHVGTLIGTQAILNNIHVDYKLSDNLPFVACEENQLKQVIINLIKNAIEAMPQGGTVRVETGIQEENHIFIKISDEGTGIPDDILMKLGEPFYTTKEYGTGLGLMVCFKIIENHLGKIKVHSELGKGTTFEILLQASPESIELAKTS